MTVKGRYNPDDENIGGDPLYVSSDPDNPSNDDWRLTINGNNLEIQVRISGSWETAQVIERPV